MLGSGLRPESNKTGTRAPMCAIRSGANAMDFRESERVETSDVATMELAKNDAPVTPESKGESKGESAPDTAPAAKLNDGSRSEEHTSELQSLMRTSYAVFCLKKKNKPQEK